MNLRSLLDKFSSDMGIDLGTANTLVYVRGQGIVVQEPSMIAIDKSSKQVMAIGKEAYKMAGRTPGNIVALRPMKDGVIADFEVTQMMVTEFIKKARPSNSFMKPRVIIGIPWGITEVEKRAVLDAANQSGAKEAYLIEEPMAAAIGANLPIEDPRGSMVVDIGGGTTEVAVISLGGIVQGRSIRTAGDEFDESIINHCKKSYNLLIGDRMAERVKIEIGSAYPFEEEKDISVKGRDLLTGLPKTFTISSYEVRDALSAAVNTIIDSVKLTLEKTPPELSADIYEDGITLAGGGALIHGLDKAIQAATKIPVKMAKDPMTCVAMGTGKMLESIPLMKKVLRL